MKRYNWQWRARQEEKALRSIGYTVFVEKPWHWEVSKEGSKILVHVWPTVGKYMVAFDIEASFYENDIVGCVNRAFTPVVVAASTEEQIEARKEITKLQDSFNSDWGNEEQV